MVTTLEGHKTAPEIDTEITGYEWMEDGNCLGLEYRIKEHTNPFFPVAQGSHKRVARSYCCGCPVVIDCLIAGLDDTEGFRGGLTEDERRRVRTRMRRGISFKSAVEATWSSNRKRGNLVPAKSVWEEWEA